ncbi:hypothetical protein ACFE04_018452 [Oxalis oulophora]
MLVVACFQVLGTKPLNTRKQISRAKESPDCTINSQFSPSLRRTDTMEEIKHSHVEVRGLKIHVAEIGSGSKAVLFLHGFPEIWYTWRNQMLAIADAAYRAIAIDCRGDNQPLPINFTIQGLWPFDIVGKALSGIRS